MTNERQRAIFGLNFSTMTQHELVEAICFSPSLPPGSGAKLFVTTNLDHVVRLWRNPAFASAYNRAWFAVIDGAPVFMYAKFRGSRVPARVTGSDLLPEIMRSLSPDAHRPYFIASKLHSAAVLERWLLSQGFAAGQFGIVVPPFGFENDKIFSDGLAAEIRQLKATHLFLGVGCPKSELWVDAHRHDIGDLYALCLGASLDFFTRTTRRAPRLFRVFFLEWLWRLIQEPRRLGKRYLVNSWAFLGAIGADIRYGGYLTPPAIGDDKGKRRNE